MTQPNKISASRIGMYTLCGLSYYNREILGLIKPPGIAARIGTATHEAIEADLKHKMDNQVLLPSEAIADIAGDALDKVLAEGGVHLTEDESANTDKTFGSAKDQSIKCAMAYHEQVAPRVHPTGVEVAFGAKLNDNWRLTMHIDCLELGRIRDTKTAATVPKEMKQSHYQQLLTYATGVYINTGELVDEVIVDMIPKLKKKAIKVTTFRAKPTIQAMNAQMQHADLVTKAIDAGVFLPADPDHWICSAKFCGYYNECPHGRAKRIQG